MNPDRRAQLLASLAEVEPEASTLTPIGEALERLEASKALVPSIADVDEHARDLADRVPGLSYEEAVVHVQQRRVGWR